MLDNSATSSSLACFWFDFFRLPIEAAKRTDLTSLLVKCLLDQCNGMHPW